MEMTFFCKGKGCGLKNLCQRYTMGMSVSFSQGKWINECGVERLGWIRK